MIPKVGFGTYSASGKDVLNALELGYTLIDCAHWYDNENEIGKTFNQWFLTHNRQDYFIISKLWNDHHNPNDVENAVRESLNDLQLQYLDLLLIHWPIQQTADNWAGGNKNFQLDIDRGYGLKDTWQALEKLVDKKLVKYIGVSNYTVQLLADLFSYARIQPFCNQIEVHLYYQNDVVVRYCEANNLLVIAYAPLGGPAGCHKLLRDKKIQSMGQKYNKTNTQIALQWHFQKYNPMLHVIIPKTSSKQKAKDNLNINFNIDDDDMKYLNSLSCGLKQDDTLYFWNYPLFPQ